MTREAPAKDLPFNIALARSGDADLDTAAATLEECGRFCAEEIPPNEAHGGAVPHLMLAGNLVAGRQMARSALAGEAFAGNRGFMIAKTATARFHANHILPETGLQRARSPLGAAV